MTLPLGSADVLAIGNEVYSAQQNGAGGFGMLQHVTIDVPIATIQAATTATPFNIGSALPANACLVAMDINLLQVVAGGSIATSCKAQVQNTGEAAGSLMGSSGGGVNVFTGATLGRYLNVGSNPYGARGGQQLQMTITTGSGALSGATTGHLAVNLWYVILP